MKYFKDFRKLCTPASVYLFINVIIFISIAIQNFGNTRHYCVGQYTCNVPNTFSMFLFKALYILFWTFVLNAICKAGYKEVSWFMVLLPIILLFILIGMVMLNSKSVRLYEGFKEGAYHSENKKNKGEHDNKENKSKNVDGSNEKGLSDEESNDNNNNNKDTDENSTDELPESFRNMFR